MWAAEQVLGPNAAFTSADSLLIEEHFHPYNTTTGHSTTKARG
jgi:hypothetical protein